TSPIWVVSGAASIVGGNTLSSVTVKANNTCSGSFTLTLTGVVGGCAASGTKTVAVQASTPSLSVVSPVNVECPNSYDPGTTGYASVTDTCYPTTTIVNVENSVWINEFNYLFRSGKYS